MCVIEFYNNNKSKVESIDGNLVDDGVITILNGDNLEFYMYEDGLIVGHK